MSDARQGVVKVADDTVGALKTSPVLLVLVLLNLCFVGGAAWYLSTQQQHVASLVEKMLDRCLPPHQP
jgi:ABC-type sulfate transport system permease component